VADWAPVTDEKEPANDSSGKKEDWYLGSCRGLPVPPGEIRCAYC